ncbi:MAG: hypothetical protein HY666_04240 [Chloroflexi bacterium]|nr:hypothetical protein [Chloroflexota bacterium]
MHNGHNGEALAASPEEVTQDILRKHREFTPRFKALVAVLAVLFLLGVVGFIIRLQDGFEHRVKWGYYAAVVVYLLTTAQAAPMVAIAPRLAKANWRRPVSRAAEMFGVVGLFNLLLFIPLLFLLPSTEGRRTIWFDGPSMSPHIWDTLAMVFLVLCGLAMLWAGSLPDMAAARDHSSGRRQGLFAKLAMGWRGTDLQWFLIRHRIGALASLYFMFLVFTHFLIASDFVLGLVPGWKDSIFPAFQALSALQSSIATMLVTMFVLRKWCGYERYIGLEQFWALSKLLLATSLLWFYFWWSGFIIFWYGRQPVEQNVISLIISGPYLPIFFTTFILNFIIPLVLLIWNAVRRSILGPTVVGCSILVGTFFDRIRLYVSAFSIEDVTAHALTVVPPAHTPDIADILIIIGALSGAGLSYALATKVFPVVNIWEIKEYMLLRVQAAFHRMEVTILAKPE